MQSRLAASRFLDLVAGVDDGDDEEEDELEEGELDELDEEDVEEMNPNEGPVLNALREQGDAERDEAFDALLKRSKQRGGQSRHTTTPFDARDGYTGEDCAASVLRRQVDLPGPDDVPLYSIQVKVRIEISDSLCLSLKFDTMIERERGGRSIPSFEQGDEDQHDGCPLDLRPAQESSGPNLHRSPQVSSHPTPLRRDALHLYILHLYGPRRRTRRPPSTKHQRPTSHQERRFRPNSKRALQGRCGRGRRCSRRKRQRR